LISARDRQREGHTLFEAARVRLRPTIMTSFAFVLGVLPLVVAEGAGAEMRRMLGVAVFAGMLGVTLFGIFLTPVFFYVVRGLAGPRQPRRAPAPVAGPQPAHGPREDGLEHAMKKAPTS
jgi:multidrug efflux pump